jgi:hypothetical protein
MAIPNTAALVAGFTELLSTTFRAVKKDVADNVSNHNALWRRLQEKGNYRYEDGGVSIQCPIEYQANSTVQRYSGFDTLNIQASDVITTAEFPWRQMAGSLPVSGFEMRANQGEARIVNLVKSKIRNLEHSLANTLSSDVYSAGSLANQINGLQALVADAGTGTVGGINSTIWTFWQNSIYDFSNNSVTASATTIMAALESIWTSTVRGKDQPDLYMADSVFWGYTVAAMEALQRYTNTQDVKAGITSLKFKGGDMVYDSSSSGMPASHIYALNTDYLELVVHRDADLEPLPERASINADATVTPVIWQGNLVVTNRARQGAIVL